MLDIGFDLKEEATLILNAVKSVLKEGYRTIDIADATSHSKKVLGTKEMGRIIVKHLRQMVPAC
jgi:3-isopropylmalate dehydrogenase